MSPRLSALGVLESLKLGVVPDEAMGALSVGCEDLLAAVDDDLSAAGAAQPAGSFRIFFGDYGTGKSHLLELAEERARTRGFLVARTAFGSREVSPDSPLAVYRALIAVLRYPSGPERGLDRLLIEAGESPEVFRRWTGRVSVGGSIVDEIFTNHLWLSPAILGHKLLTATGLDEGVERLRAWMGGQPSPPPALRRILGVAAAQVGLSRGHGLTGPAQIRGIPRWRSVPQIPCYILGGIGSLARDLGYAGLALFLDEGEHFQWMTSRRTEHAINLAKGLQATSLSGYPVDILPRGGRRNHRLVPYRFHEAQHVACFVALAPQSESGEALAALAAVEKSRRSHIPALTSPQLIDLASRVLELATTADLDSPHLPAYRQLLFQHIDQECRAGRPLPPRRVVKLAAFLPDTVRAAGEAPVDPRLFMSAGLDRFG